LLKAVASHRATKQNFKIRKAKQRALRYNSPSMEARLGTESHYTRYLDDLKIILDNLPLAQAKRAADILYEAYQADHTVFAFGNGGSAALASHMVADLGKATHFPGPASIQKTKRLRAVSVTDNVPLLTAWANDSKYENVFAGQIENLIQRSDVAIAISGSGDSPNVLCALELARRVGATTIGLAGRIGGKMKDLLVCAIIVPSNCMQQIEDAHAILAHLIFLDFKSRIERAVTSAK
jgi:D-sedoheptulose 7-phosphate isomerase